MFPRYLLQALTALPLFSSAAFAQTACNNSPSLCHRPYNNITYLGAHDSPFLRSAATSFSTAGNHGYSTTVQLDSGVRLVTAQVHKVAVNGQTEWHLCHTSCDLLDAGTLQNWLTEIRTWMDANPHDVVTVLLVNSDKAPVATLGASFTGSGIDKYAYTPPSSTVVPAKWPTLDKLIGNNTRLMAFVASIDTPDPAFPYLMDEFTFLFENNYNNLNTSSYSCTPDRPTNLKDPAAALSSGRMFLMNHFLYQSNALFQSPNDTYVLITNADTGLGSMGDSIRECTAVYEKPPSFVLVDFFNAGPAIASVDIANGVNDISGRKNVGTQLTTQGGSGSRRGSAAGRTQGSLLAAVVACGVAMVWGL